MKDASFFDRVNRDYYRFAGAPKTSLKYFILTVGDFDPLYLEDRNPAYTPYMIASSFTFEEADNKDLDVGDQGLVESEYDAELALSKTIWQETVNGGKPKQGDIVCLNPDTSPRWFIVMKVLEHGNVRTTGIFTEWKLTLKERGSFSALENIR